MPEHLAAQVQVCCMQQQRFLIQYIGGRKMCKLHQKALFMSTHLFYRARAAWFEWLGTGLPEPLTLAS